MDWNYLYTSFDGRINRKPYWIANLVLILCGMTLLILILSTLGMFAALVFGLVWIYPTFSLNVKRAHDRNRPTWLVVVFFGLLVFINLIQIFGFDRIGGEPTAFFLIVAIPWFLLALFFFVDLGFLRGKAGPARSGPAPLR